MRYLDSAINPNGVPPRPTVMLARVPNLKHHDHHGGGVSTQHNRITHKNAPCAGLERRLLVNRPVMLLPSFWICTVSLNSSGSICSRCQGVIK